jgi:hypothetical protein
MGRDRFETSAAADQQITWWVTDTDRLKDSGVRPDGRRTCPVLVRAAKRQGVLCKQLARKSVAVSAIAA